jgi:hypothetical protein
LTIRCAIELAESAGRIHQRFRSERDQRSLPVEPDGLAFEASIIPYADAIDTCHNLAYIVNQDETFMAEVDLTKLQKNPGAISTALPSGKCAGTSTTLSCNNQNGVRFFPLPGV